MHFCRSNIVPRLFRAQLVSTPATDARYPSALGVDSTD